MAEQAGNIPQLVGLVAVHHVVVFDEGLLEQVHPHAVEAGHAFAD
jgi:hypothetical protein